MIPMTDYVQEPDGGDEDVVVGVEDNNNHNCRCLERSKRKD